MVVFGVGMCYDLKRKECTLAFIGQLAYMAYSLYDNEKLNYSPWLKVSVDNS